MKSSLAANIISILIFIMGFAMHLNKCTARTPIGTAAIIQTTLTAGTLDIVLLTHIVPCKRQCNNDVEEKGVGNQVIHDCSQSVSAIGSCVSIAKRIRKDYSDNPSCQRDDSHNDTSIRSLARFATDHVVLHTLKDLTREDSSAAPSHEEGTAAGVEAGA